jgi:hypothetical protein
MNPTKCWSGNLKGRDHLGNEGVDGIGIALDLKEWGSVKGT